MGKQHARRMREATMTEAEALLWARRRYANSLRWPRRRYRVEDSGVGNSPLTTRARAEAMCKRYGGVVVELIPKFYAAAAQVLAEVE